VKGVGSGSGIISQSKNSLLGSFKLRARKNGGSTGKTGRGRETVDRSCRTVHKSCRDFRDTAKKG